MTSQALPRTLGAKPPPGVAEVLGVALAQARDAAGVVVAAVPAPLAPVEALFDAARHEDGLVWAPPEGPAFAALGAAAAFTGSGSERFAEVRSAAEALFGGLVCAAAPEGAPAPRCFGGFAFQSGGASREPWAEFGDARFVLPRFTYSREGDRAFLSLALRPEEVANEARRRSLVATAEHLFGALLVASARGPVSQPPATERVVAEREETSSAEWRELVLGVRELIRRGDFEKVVVARRSALSFHQEIRDAEVLAELARTADLCTRFAIRHGRSTFLGATPERLVRRVGLDVETEALAGSNRPGDPARAEELLRSAKEQAEHAPVVREIVRALEPLCERLEYPERPEVRSLRHVIHLRTPVRGRLARLVHVLELVERLHPTPAVGGVPRGPAMRLIAERESAERGWYAAPVGWFDGSGDGEFVVGLRSGVLVNDRAYLYAGGGIVSDSDPESEYAETRLKLATLAAALRVAQ